MIFSETKTLELQIFLVDFCKEDQTPGEICLIDFYVLNLIKGTPEKKEAYYEYYTEE